MERPDRTTLATSVECRSSTTDTTTTTTVVDERDALVRVAKAEEILRLRRVKLFGGVGIVIEHLTNGDEYFTLVSSVVLRLPYSFRV